MGAVTAQEPDRVEIRGGAVLTGRIESVTDKSIQLQTTYAGMVQIDLGQVERVVARSELNGQIPSSLKTASQPPVVKPKPASKPAAPAGKRWQIEAGFNLVGSQGNSEKIDLGLSLDARLRREFDRMDLYGRYTYGKNRGTLAANELILGGRYTNFFFKNIGFFFREELEHDDFEGLSFRSTSATGVSWRYREDEELHIEARSGLSYRYQIHEEGYHADYPGMDFGLDVNWKFAPWIHFKGTYALIPSISDTDDYIIKQDSGFNIPLDVTKFWKLSIGLVSKYNSRPDGNRERLDHKYYARLVASWK